MGDQGQAQNGWLILRVHLMMKQDRDRAFLDRRDCLRLMLGGAIGSGVGAGGVVAQSSRTRGPAS